MMLRSMIVLLVVTNGISVAFGELVDGYNIDARTPVTNLFGEPVAQTFEGISRIGWYYYNGPSYVLTRIETRFDARNIGPPLEFTTLPITISLYTDRPAVGGQLLTSATFNANLLSGAIQGVDLPPVFLPANQRFFVGFSGLDPVDGEGFTDNAIGVNFSYWEYNGANLPEFASGVNTDLGAYYIQETYSQEVTNKFEQTNNTAQARTAPILFFHGVRAVPEPTSMILLGTSLAAFGVRRFARHYKLDT